MTTPFLWEPGTGNDGNYASALSLMTTELNSLVNGSLVVSSVGGSSGLFSNSNTAQVMFGVPQLTLGAITPTAGGHLDAWFLESFDGSTFEQTTAPLRTPDFTFVPPASAITAGWVFLSPGRLTRLPALKFKLLVQNNLGATLAASGNIVKVGLIAPQY